MIPAFDFLKGKGIEVTWNWNSFQAQEHLYAFTSAKIMREDVLASIKKSLVKAENGRLTKKEAKLLIAKELKSSGLWGKVFVENPSTKKLNYVTVGSNWRVETIVATNLQSGFMSRKWQNIQSLKTFRPYLQYKTERDDLVRPTHRVLHNKIWHVNNKIWQRIYPPNGYNCRCDVLQLTEAQAKAKGITTSTTVPENFPDAGFAGNVGTNRTQIFKSYEKRASRLSRKKESQFLDGLIASTALADYLATIDQENFMTKNYFAGFLPTFVGRNAELDSLSVSLTNKLAKKDLGVSQATQIPQAIWRSRSFYKRGAIILVVVTLENKEKKVITIQTGQFENKIIKIEDYDIDLIQEATKI
jgi:SPP1 gp7 family putative phage head morphogenesis protein